jgi:hypothetical protein
MKYFAPKGYEFVFLYGLVGLAENLRGESFTYFLLNLLDE